MTTKELDEEIDNVKFYLHYFLTNRALELSFKRTFYPIMSADDFRIKMSPQFASCTFLEEWKIKYPNREIQ